MTRDAVTPTAGDTHAGEIDERFRLRADATAELDDGRLVLSFAARRFAIRPIAAGMAAVVDALKHSALGQAELGGLVDGDEEASRQVGPLLARLVERGWLEHTLCLAGRPLVTSRPIATFHADPGLGTSPRVALSRFALLRRQGTDAVIESPRSPALMVLHEPKLAALVAWLASPRRPDDVAASGADLPPEAARGVLQMFSEAGLLVGIDDTGDEGGAGGRGKSEEEATQHLAQWNPTDLFFHSRSRGGRHANPFGGTWPLKGSFDPLPAMPPFTGEPIPLTRPDLAAVAAADPPFTAVLEGRRSVREHDDETPITLAQLGELLYRAARVRTTTDPFHDGVQRERGTDRPYPSGGALYELGLYPVVRLCDGLEPGLYRYDPFEHRLGRLAGWSTEVELLLEDGKARSLMTQMPQMLIGVTARFGRVMYKYEAMAYATILKNVGVLYQTLYCVATAMGLAPCALGGGDANRLADVAALDYYAQSSVGEFLLGSSRNGG